SSASAAGNGHGLRHHYSRRRRNGDPQLIGPLMSDPSVIDRGFLRKGAPADIAVYDVAELKRTPEREFEILHDRPAGEWRVAQRAAGYRWPLINGEITFENGRPFHSARPMGDFRWPTTHICSTTPGATPSPITRCR